MVPYYAELSLAQYLLRPEVRRPRARNVTPVLWEYNPLLQKNNPHQERLFFFFLFSLLLPPISCGKKKSTLSCLLSLFCLLLGEMLTEKTWNEESELELVSVTIPPVLPYHVNVKIEVSVSCYFFFYPYSEKYSLPWKNVYGGWSHFGLRWLLEQ